MIHAYNGHTADAVWRQVWGDVVASTMIRKNGHKGHSTEVLHVAFGLSDPRQRIVLSRVPGLNPAFAVAEVVWILRGRNDAAFLRPWNGALASFTGAEDYLHGAYGHRLRNHFNFDQLERAMSVLGSDAGQRQVVLQIWDAENDTPHPDGQAKSNDIPCNILSLLKVVDGRLDWLQVMRSNDLILGLPYNIFQWTTLQEVFAGWLGIEMGSYNHVSDSLHIYARDRDSYSISGSVTAFRNTDDLRLPLAESERVLSILERAIEHMASSLDPDDITTTLYDAEVPDAYSNWLRVIASERLRRIGRSRSAATVLEEISNPAYKESVRIWNSRFGDAL